MASERDKKQRLEDNKGVEDGTIRKGKGGKSIRKYDSESGRWKKVSIKAAAKRKATAKRYGSVLKRGGRDDSGSRPSSRSDKNVGLGGSAPTFRRPGRRPVQEKVVNVKTDPGEARRAKARAALSARTSAKSPRKIPNGFVVLRGDPPKKYKWNGERFERYTGPRPPSPKRS